MNWLQETEEAIKKLRASGYFDDWGIVQLPHIVFHIHPETVVGSDWLDIREATYVKNASLLNVEPLVCDFFVYPSRDFAKPLGVTAAAALPSVREVHGHPNQSPGHELTHLLLRQVVDWRVLPANGFWSEGVCTFLDGTNTDRRHHVTTIKYQEDILATAWEVWREHMPGDLYPITGSVIQFLDERFTWKKVLELIRSLTSEAGSAGRVLEVVTGKTAAQIHEDWLGWLQWK